MYVAKEPLFAAGICLGDTGTVVSERMVELYDLTDKVEKVADRKSEDERIAASTPKVTQTPVDEQGHLIGDAPPQPEQSATDAAEGDASMVGTSGTSRGKAGK